MKLLLPLIVCFALISSCTVEKRLYNKGFHIEWKKKIHAADNNVSSTDDQVPDAENTETSADLPVAEIVPVESRSVEESPVDTDLSAVSEPEHESGFDEHLLSVPVKDTVYIDDSGTRLEPVGVASALALVGSVLSLYLPMGAIPYIGLFLFAAAFILSIVSIVRYALYRDYYKNNVLGVLTFILCLIAILVFAILIIALIAAF